ncbi:MAG: TonB-dependent receptor [Thermonemataceae bacterium]|nr:TonB-dependent receptor [Thermonemataceae bacterium]
MKQFLLFILLMSYASGYLEAQCNSTIHGHLYEQKSKRNVVKAKVLLKELGLQTFSNTNGEFEFAGICEGQYSLLISKEGYDSIQVATAIKKEQKHLHQDFYLQKAEDFLEAVEISSQKEAAISTQTQYTLSEKELENARGKNLGEMLKTIAGVTALNTGNGISKPMIHGLHSQRILLLNNGVRQEGQQWGEEHAPEIDVFAAEQISVLKGAAGVRYGADAVAGVVILAPKNLPQSKKLLGKTYIIGHSNSQMLNMAMQVEKAFGKGWAWRLQTSAKKAGDFHSPTYTLSNTGLQEFNVSATLGYQHKNWQNELYLSSYQTEIGVLRAAHTGNIQDLANSISRLEPWYVAPFTYEINNPKQKIAHYLLKWHSQIDLKDKGNLDLQYAFQENIRKEFDIRRGGRSATPALSLELQSHTLDAVWEHHTWRNFRGSIGTNALYQNNYNVPETGIIPLLPNFSTYSQGFFWLERFIKTRYDIEWGLRYDFRTTQVKTFIDNEIFIQPTYQFNYFTATLGYGFYPTDKLSFKTNIGATYRPPHTAELFSQGLHLGIGNIQEGLLFENGFLNPDKKFSLEKAYKWINTLSLKNQYWNFEFSPYWHWIDNFVYATPTDIRLTIRGTFPVFSYVQSNVSILGFDFTSRYERKNISWQSKLAYLYAEIRQNKDALINMPPLRWENSLAYKILLRDNENEIRIFLETLYMAKQSNAPRVVAPENFDNISEADKNEILSAGNFDFMATPDAYFLIGAGIESDLKKRYHILFKTENLLNTSYRDYLNRWRYYANELGRNFILQFSYSF